MVISLIINLVDGDSLTIPLELGKPLYVVGPNRSGKSALIQHAVMSLGVGNIRRVSAHRQTWLGSGAIDITAQSRRQFDQQLAGQEPNPEYRWREWNPQGRLSAVLFDLTAMDNDQARRVRDFNFSREFDAALNIVENERPIFERINDLLSVAGLKVRIENSKSEEILAQHYEASTPYSMAQMSDGERNAVLLAANVLTVAPYTVLLIDEPERHLHRSIIEPLLSALFDERPDCAFVVSTHEIALAMFNPQSSVLSVRSCQWNGNAAVAWDAKLLDSNAELPEDLKRAILGSRRRTLFVEGEAQGLDVQLYNALFSDISVSPVGDCDQVIRAVTGLRNSMELYDIEAFGLIDADNRSSDEIARMSQKGIYALNAYSVESIYYCSDAIEALAIQQAETLEIDASEMIEAVRSGALAALRNPSVPERMAARRCERKVREQVRSQMPNWETIKDGTYRPIKVDTDLWYKEELDRFNSLLAADDLEGITARYPVRYSDVIAEIEKGLEISKKHYSRTLISRIRRDPELADKLRNRIEPLASELAMSD